MRTIHKLFLKVEDVQTHTIPQYAKFLAVQIQHGVPCLWFECDTSRPPMPRIIKTFGTGHEMPDGEALRHVGTYQLHDGAIVFHVFEQLSAIDALAEVI